MSATDPYLTRKMRALADAQGLPASHELRVRADDFERAVADFYAVPQRCSVKQFMKAWVGARRLYIAHTGGTLMSD